MAEMFANATQILEPFRGIKKVTSRNISRRAIARARAASRR